MQMAELVLSDGACFIWAGALALAGTARGKEVLKLARGKGRSSGKGKSAPKGKSRSAITGRYVTRAHANRSPRTTVTEKK